MRLTASAAIGVAAIALIICGCGSGGECSDDGVPSRPSGSIHDINKWSPCADIPDVDVVAAQLDSTSKTEEVSDDGNVVPDRHLCTWVGRDPWYYVNIYSAFESVDGTIAESAARSESLAWKNPKVVNVNGRMATQQIQETFPRNNLGCGLIFPVGRGTIIMEIFYNMGYPLLPGYREDSIGDTCEKLNETAGVLVRDFPREA